MVMVANMNIYTRFNIKTIEQTYVSVY